MTKNDLKIMMSTQDDWFPNFPGNLVRVRYSQLTPDVDGMYRVSVWGADNFGMERDFVHSSQAWEMFEKLSVLPFVNKEDLYKLGFDVA